jgi:hypothetical protein
MLAGGIVNADDEHPAGDAVGQPCAIGITAVARLKMIGSGQKAAPPRAA